MVSTGELLSISQSSVLLPRSRSRAWIQGQSRVPCYKALKTASSNSTRALALTVTSNYLTNGPISNNQRSRKRISTVIRGSVVPEKLPTAFSADFVEGTETQLDNSGGGGGDIGGSEGNNWGGSGGGGDGEGPSDDSGKEPKKSGMSMSQKLTLGYAALVGLGGLMGYLKSGSQKSLLSGGISAALLYYVYTQLPVNPVFASCIGLGLSAALLGVMGTRFKNSGKVFPAGVVSLVSLIMTGGYLHGVMRSFH
uniref:protein FATTY ACID EXPORT 2, chloroplastic-like n=1 Tax=Erigeron canadensis TaxID=72917 RepID=UPI001CB914F5|nr:protein FATTY ACID EXPORT 2, chloroplastic-like [Erigeron canadensis]